MWTTTGFSTIRWMKVIAPGSSTYSGATGMKLSRPTPCSGWATPISQAIRQRSLRPSPRSLKSVSRSKLPGESAREIATTTIAAAATPSTARRRPRITTRAVARTTIAPIAPPRDSVPATVRAKIAIAPSRASLAATLRVPLSRPAARAMPAIAAAESTLGSPVPPWIRLSIGSELTGPPLKPSSPSRAVIAAPTTKAAAIRRSWPLPPIATARAARTATPIVSFHSWVMATPGAGAQRTVSAIQARKSRATARNGAAARVWARIVARSRVQA